MRSSAIDCSAKGITAVSRESIEPAQAYPLVLRREPLGQIGLPHNVPGDAPFHVKRVLRRSPATVAEEVPRRRPSKLPTDRRQGSGLPRSVEPTFGRGSLRVRSVPVPGRWQASGAHELPPARLRAPALATGEGSLQQAGFPSARGAELASSTTRGQGSKRFTWSSGCSSDRGPARAPTPALEPRPHQGDGTRPDVRRE